MRLMKMTMTDGDFSVDDADIDDVDRARGARAEPAGDARAKGDCRAELCACGGCECGGARGGVCGACVRVGMGSGRAGWGGVAFASFLFFDFGKLLRVFF